MKTRAKTLRQPDLHAKVAIPDDTFEKRIDEGDDQHRGAQLRGEACTLGDAAGDDRRDRRGKGQQEEELHQAVAMLLAQHLCRL
ncbi:hypothetical protein D3C85_1248640 [compost metagenome]